MSRRRMGPFPSLKGLPEINVNTATDAVILERMDLLHECLSTMGLNCAGHAAGQQNDEYWGADISELISRCTAHEIIHRDFEGNVRKEVVKIKLESLTFEIDANNEICAWIYEES